MKLLFDQNLSPRLASKLSQVYPDSNHVYSLGLDRVSDYEVREYARREGFLIVTKDADFGELCVLHGFPPKVIWIRIGNCSTEAIAQVLQEHAGDVATLASDSTMGVLVLV